MEFKRKLYSRLLDWKKGNGATAMMIEGARRIGKSTLAEMFARNEYRSYILIDFNKVDKAVISAFENHLTDLDTFFLILSSVYNIKLYRRESVVIFDEIQQYPKARQAVKYFVQDGRYDFIETGSLISINENVRDITIPSEEETLKMYPMDFEEFLWAMNEDMKVELIRHQYNNAQPLDDALHGKCMMLFRQYMIVGGMPKSIASYIENDRDFKVADIEKRRILKLYREDIMKIDSRYRSRVLAIFDQIPGLLSRQDKRVVLKEFEVGAAYNTYEDTFFWLKDSMIANECFNCSDPNVGLSVNEIRTYIKCYMGDTGLLVSHAFNENELSDGELFREILFKRLSLNEGMFFENAIMQMLVAAGHRPYFYVRYNKEKHRNDIEIDFLISNKSKLNYKVYPIEVKSTDRYSTVSLGKFKAVFGSKVGGCYVVHPKNFKIQDGIAYLPAYMTFCL